MRNFWAVPLALLIAGTSWARDDHDEDRGARDRETRSQQREWREQRQPRESITNDGRGEKQVDRERGRTSGRDDEDRIRTSPEAFRSTAETLEGSSKSSTTEKSESGAEDNESMFRDAESSDGSERGDEEGDLDSGEERSGDDRGDEDRLDDRVRVGTTVARMELDRDRQGHERRRDEVLLVGSNESITAIRAAGFTILAQQSLPSLNEIIARIRVRSGSSIEQLIAELRALAPDASIAPNHVFRPSEDMNFNASSSKVSVPFGQPDGALIGVIDTGVDTASSMQSRVIVTKGFAEGGYLPRSHGTLVAEIAASGGARLASADVFGVDTDNRLVASAEAIASAIDWLVGNRVPVINISIEGPENVVLEHVIRVALASNVAIVAAAGNRGPAAPPSYPAAYKGVLAVTAIDEADHVYRRANQGDYISFAARGVHIPVNGGRGSARTTSGTSFAAPVVAAEIARRLRASRDSQLGDVIASLKRDARDLGALGRDAVYGWGKIVVAQPLTAESN